MPPRPFSSRAWVCSAVPPIFEEIRSDSVASTKRNSSLRTPASKSTCPNRRATVVSLYQDFPIKAACKVCFSGALPLAIRFLLEIPPCWSFSWSHVWLFKTNQAIEFLKSILFLLWSRVSCGGWSHRCIHRLSRRNDLRIALGHFSTNEIVTTILDFLGQITRIALPIGYGACLHKGPLWSRILGSAILWQIICSAISTLSSKTPNDMVWAFSFKKSFLQSKKQMMLHRRIKTL